ncbi:MAG: patatin-like phospholipase family protein [Frankia sp.]
MEREPRVRTTHGSTRAEVAGVGDGPPTGRPVGGGVAIGRSVAHTRPRRPARHGSPDPVQRGGAGRPGGTRRGLVLGGGGVLGSAWMTGALHAYEEATGVDPRTMEIIVGTSAGAVLAALAGHHVSTATMVDQQRGVLLDGVPYLDYARINATAPPTPRLRLGSGRLLVASARNPRSVTFLIALTAVLPQGRGTMEPVEKLIESAGLGRRGGWPAFPRVWIVAMDYATGERVVFGRPGAPAAKLSRAVVASCAIPGWYEPVRIGDRLYVDGGARSATSLDLLADLGLDEVLVLAPAASFDTDHPRHPAARLERRFRRSVTRRLLREAALVRASGTAVTMLAPGREDLAEIGANLMDVQRVPRVLETSLRTSATALAALRGDPTPA